MLAARRRYTSRHREGVITSLEISRAKALAIFPGCRAAWEAARGENVFENEQNRLFLSL
jgi:hypothetical protein